MLFNIGFASAADYFMASKKYLRSSQPPLAGVAKSNQRQDELNKAQYSLFKAPHTN